MKAEDAKKTAQRAKWAVIIGILLALACHTVPENYRAVCEVLASVCTGGH